MKYNDPIEGKWKDVPLCVESIQPVCLGGLYNSKVYTDEMQERDIYVKFKRQEEKYIQTLGGDKEYLHLTLAWYYTKQGFGSRRYKLLHCLYHTILSLFYGLFNRNNYAFLRYLTQNKEPVRYKVCDIKGMKQDA